MKPKVALVYDRVNTAYGGAEKVLVALHQLFPEAPLFTSVVNTDIATWAKDFKIIPSFLQRWPKANQAHRWLAMFMPLAFESFTLDEYDIVISITSAEAKGVLTKPNQLHICYLLTPTRYLYSHEQAYLEEDLRSPLLQALAAPFLKYLKWWDQAAAFRPDVLIPISELVSQRIIEFYNQQPSGVLYPPVELVTHLPSETPVHLSKLPKDFYLVVSRLVPYKKVELAIKACQYLHRSLVIVGNGPQKQQLEALAGSNSNIVFLNDLPTSELQYLYAHATALLMLGIEDFGITALEAVGAGLPVITHQQSGAAELLTQNQEAVFITELTVDAVCKAMQILESQSFNKIKMRKKIQNYGTTEFCKAFQERIDQEWHKFASERIYESR